jgi:hypothetical protein
MMPEPDDDLPPARQPGSYSTGEADTPSASAPVRAWQRYLARLHQKSRWTAAFLHRRMAILCALWLALTFALAGFRLAHPAGPIHHLRDAAPTLLAYTLIILAPVLGYLVARGASRTRTAKVQPSYRFALFGRWRKLSPADARARPEFGPVGFMASLLVGMLLNVVVRAVEFFAAIPVVGPHAPPWAQTMFTWMALDVIVAGFFYMVVFVMALRTMPLFPRMLLFAWLLDVAMQLVIAQRLALVGGIPPELAGPLQTLLDGNIKKVLISAAVWLPYLLLSERVNVTYRHRTGA